VNSVYYHSIVSCFGELQLLCVCVCGVWGVGGCVCMGVCVCVCVGVGGCVCMGVCVGGG